jgi:hypothetical protein
MAIHFSREGCVSRERGIDAYPLVGLGLRRGVPVGDEAEQRRYFPKQAGDGFAADCGPWKGPLTRN